MLTTLLILLLSASNSFTITNFPVVIEAEVTKYSELDSCHYPKNGKCLVATGDEAFIGGIACPRSWPLGVIAEIEGRAYICNDRYNENLSDRLDIWAGYGQEAYQEAKRFGIQTHQIKLY